MSRKIFFFAAVFSLAFIFVACQGHFSVSGSLGKTAWLDELDLSKAQTQTAKITVNKSIDGNSLTINGQKYERGIGTNTPVKITLALDGKANRFTALTGADDEARTAASGAAFGRGRGGRGFQRGNVQFVVVGDNKILFKSSVKRPGTEPNEVDVDLSKVKELQLISAEADSPAGDHADWAMAKIDYSGKAPVVVESKPLVAEKYILTPKPGPKPKITGPKIFGVRPGNPFLFTATATGDRPIVFGAEGLPAGLTIDSSNGHITGTVSQKGEYKVTLIARNNLGVAQREFRIVCGDTIALTPPLGWNSWNCWGPAVDAEKVRASAKAMYDSGLINHGWSYMNIDDVWMRAPANSTRNRNDPTLAPPPRDEQGNILPNGRFPDMKGLCDYIHSLGLKVGIYSSPGPTTCQGLEASWQHELQDAQTYANWGIDYLKYDWCGYSSIAGRNAPLEELQKPYIFMRKCLDQVPRDIVYSLCQYGDGRVWEWGESVGGNCWRTTGDITDTWASMARGFNEAPHAKYAKPGHWNDPDMMVLGKVGWGPNLRDARLTADEQYTHMTLWCMLCSPLLLGCPLDQLDDFTLSLLTNDEVLEVNQDPLGQQANRIYQEGGREIWVKMMEDGSTVVALFNREDYVPQDITLNFADVGLDGSKCVVRDLWRQKDLGTFSNSYTANVPIHGVVLVKLTKK